MKISMMTNDQAADALVKMAQPMANLMEDKETAELLETLTKTSSDGGAFAYLGTVLPKIVSFCMKNHKDDVFAIVGALTQKPTSVVGRMNFLETVKELKESIDEDFLGFLRQSEPMTEKLGD